MRTKPVRGTGSGAMNATAVGLQGRAVGQREANPGDDAVISRSMLKSRRGLLAPVLLAAATLLAPAGAGAAHYVDEGNNCYGCHTVDYQEAENGTSLIASSSRTLLLMKLYNAGGTVPQNFGCTYCHSNPANTAMKDALDHFGAKTSKHPVGFSLKFTFFQKSG